MVVALLVVFTAMAPLLVAASLGSKDWPPLLFALLWIAILGWNAYWFLLRLCYRIELREARLCWWAPARRGSLPLDRLRVVRPSRFAFNLAVFESDSGAAVLVLVQRGFAEFAAQVQAAAPKANVRIGRYARIVNRLPGFNGFWPGR